MKNRKNERITEENVEKIATRIAIKALKTNFTQGKTDESKPVTGGFGYLWRLYSGLIADIANASDTDYTHSDGYDLVEIVVVSLIPYIGKTLDDIADCNEKTKNGESITILRKAFRDVNRYIAREKRRSYKTAYVDDLTSTGDVVYYAIPHGWDMPTYTDYKKVGELIKDLKLTVMERKILHYRLTGVAVDYEEYINGQPTQRDERGLTTIAEKIGISRQAVHKHLKNIRMKALEIGLSPKGKKE